MHSIHVDTASIGLLTPARYRHFSSDPASVPVRCIGTTIDIFNTYAVSTETNTNAKTGQKKRSLADTTSAILQFNMKFQVQHGEVCRPTYRHLGRQQEVSHYHHTSTMLQVQLSSMIPTTGWVTGSPPSNLLFQPADQFFVPPRNRYE